MSKSRQGEVTEVGPSRRLNGMPTRAFSHEFEGGGALAAAGIKDQIVLQETPTGRLRMTATVYETVDRPFVSLSVQRWNGARKPQEFFALNAGECVKFIEFINRIKTTTLDRVSDFTIFDKQVDTLLTADDIDLNKLEAAARKTPENLEALAKLVEGHSFRDLKAVAYRRSQLEHFKRLLEDDGFREEQRIEHGGPEKLWQRFFERNHWIFGYGLSYLPLSKLSGKKLENYILGRSLAGPGKEADAVMKSNALISGLSIVEIKTPYEDRLLAPRPARSGVYHPSEELTQAVAQIQVTVQMAVEDYQHSLSLETAGGHKTGEELRFVQPRAFLVVGHLGQLRGPHGVNNQEYRSFETYRRSLRSPEIFTFDELYERARHIVSDGEAEPDY